MQNLINGLQKIDTQIKQLRQEQNEVFIQHGEGCEAPEFMQKEYREQYDSMGRDLNILHDYLMRVRANIDSAVNYIFINLS